VRPLQQNKLCNCRDPRTNSNPEKAAANTPLRVTTQLRDSDNPQLLQDLKATLLKLELRRTDLLSKFRPSYPPVQELDQEIANT
jgi:uncharacterized protein involved in exopolysaccharide biosynthesis